MRWTAQYSYISSNEQRRDDFRERVVLNDADRTQPNIRYKLMNNYPCATITLFCYYIIDYETILLKIYYSKATPHFGPRRRRRCSYLSALYTHLIKVLWLQYNTRSLMGSWYVPSPSFVSIGRVFIEYDRPKAAGCTIGRRRKRAIVRLLCLCRR